MHGLNRRDFLGWAAGAAATCALPHQARGAQAEGQRPNFLFIMSDDHASHAMSCYGSRINKTPNLDRIAAEGMRLTNCFCTNSICGPSRATILTGKYSHANGFFRNGRTFDGAQQTFPKLLQKAGYQTAMIGKWHLRSQPTGFDYWNVLPGQGAYHNPVLIEMGKRKKHAGYVTDLITDFTIGWLKTGRDPSKPFLLMCHHKAPHRNWQPAKRHATLYDDRDIPEPLTFNDDHSGHGTAAREAQMTIDRHLTRSDLKMPPPKGITGQALKKWKYQRYIKDYLRCIKAVDENVGRLLDFLDKAGLAQNTVVVYTSDQGFYLGDHNWFDKRFIYEESLRMPFVVRYPRGIKPGTVTGDIVLNTDFGPAFLDYAGVATPADMHGRSFRPVLEGRTPADWRTSMYYHYYEYPGAHMVRRHYGIRTQRYTLAHYYRIDEWELFDLEKDPHQLKSVYADPAYTSVVKELKAELERLRAELKVPDDKPAPPPPAAKGPQLILGLDEPAGARHAADTSGAKRSLIYHGTKPAAGRKGQARLFNGTSDYLELPGNACPNPAGTPITVAAWVKPSKPDGVVLAQGGRSWGYALHVQGGKAALSLRIAGQCATADARLPDGWCHVAGHLAKGGRMTLFVNGRPVAQAKAPGLLPRMPSDPLQVGCDLNSNAGPYEGNNHFGGLIDELKLIFGTRTPEQIAADAR